MTYDEKLMTRVREALSGASRVEEKRMFGGLAFMVNGKLCVSVGLSRIMCRVDPAMHGKLVRKRGCRTVTMKGREYKRYVRVEKMALETREDVDYWVGLALHFNRRARAAPK